MNKQEEWREIDGFPSYMVSSLSRVKSLARRVSCGPNGGKREIKETILSPFVCKNTGYLQVVFERKKQNLHRLVAFAFLGAPPTDKHQVNHKNGIRTDCSISNLEWVTPGENVRHGFSSNGRQAHNKGKTGKDSPASVPVIATNPLTGEEKYYESGADAVREGFRSDGICRACKGQIRSHAGLIWRYAMNEIVLTEPKIEPPEGYR